MVAWREAAEIETVIDAGTPVSSKSSLSTSPLKSSPPERSTVTVAPSRLASVSGDGLVEAINADSSVTRTLTAAAAAPP